MLTGSLKSLHLENPKLKPDYVLEDLEVWFCSSSSRLVQRLH